MFWRNKATPPSPDSDIQLPNFDQCQFSLENAPECDMIMKGGITSGIVYPYAILQIATKFRLRSVGGTSVGAIAAAFAAAAEYARANGRPEGFLILKQYCDELPERLLSLFQTSPELTPAVECVKSTLTAGKFKLPVLRAILAFLLSGCIGALLPGLLLVMLQSNSYITALATILSFGVAGTIGLLFWIWWTFWRPLANAVAKLPAANFGFCTGLTQPYATSPGLTDWIHRALQHIAFGDPDHPVPLTFGDLRGPNPDMPRIDLQVVTTNLSMRRPHTLPKLGMVAGFEPADWNKLFPKAVMDYICVEATQPWDIYPNANEFPSEDKLPVLIAVRMSLSFPLLFTAVPVIVKDNELLSIAKALGGAADGGFRKVHLSDGGISSNFPIHMFDAPLPTRPTFAFSLEDLTLEPVERRVALPQSASDGMGVQIKQIETLQTFAFQILNSAKDWQDQLLSEITGQRERIARIFLNDAEGGLNLNMSRTTSRRLMLWGYEAGCKFTDAVDAGGFDFDEHKWRRLLVLYKHLEGNLDAIDRIWNGGFNAWYSGYLPVAKSYSHVNKGDRQKIARNIAKLLAARDSDGTSAIKNRNEKFPKKAGVLKVAPKY